MSVRMQLLVLLLVLQAEADQRGDLGVVAAAGEQRLHALVDVGAIALDVGEAGPRDEAALRPRVLLADTLVVAVEENAKGRVEGNEAGLEALEQEGLEEPGDVGEVPLGRARVGHRLHLAVLGRQRRGERQARGTHARVARGEGRGRAARGACFGVIVGVSSAAVRACRGGTRQGSRNRRSRV